MLVFNRKNIQITTDFEKKTVICALLLCREGGGGELEAVGLSINQPETAEKSIS
jgi:hypothetical protein